MPRENTQTQLLQQLMSWFAYRQQCECRCDLDVNYICENCYEVELLRQVVSVIREKVECMNGYVVCVRYDADDVAIAAMSELCDAVSLADKLQADPLLIYPQYRQAFEALCLQILQDRDPSYVRVIEIRDGLVVGCPIELKIHVRRKV